MTQLEEGGGHVLCVIMTQCVRKSICNIQLKVKFVEDNL